VRSVLIAAVVLGGCALAGVKAPAKPQPDRLPDFAPAPPPGDPHAPYGVGKAPFANLPATSCAAAACHGGGQVGKVGSEHTTWAPELGAAGPGDPHNRAYRVLFNEVSVRMGELLGIKEPHKEARCLACHAVDPGGVPEARDPVLAEGVGCSGCHGPAEKWVGVHYLPEWQALPNEKKWKDYGFVPTKNLVARTLTCAKCHVGDAERDMNHDLIAAGHPRLAFEAAAFHYKPDYRKHWSEQMPQPEFEAREWVVGQAAALRAAAELLRARAEKAEKGHAVWPEFSEYSCYACHQKVGEKALRGVAGANPRPAGVPGWELWYNSAAGIAADYCGTAYPALSSADLRGALKLAAVKQLRSTMEAKRFPAPGKVRERAAAAVAELDAWLAAMQRAQDRGLKPLPPRTAEKLAHALASNALAKGPGGEPVLADHDWDALAANYLGCAAMFHAKWAENPAGPEPAWGRKLWALRDELEFPALVNTSGKRVGRFNSPAGLTQKRLTDLRNTFESLRDATAPRGGD
jgi:hypothetical protein